MDHYAGVFLSSFMVGQDQGNFQEGTRKPTWARTEDEHTREEEKENYVETREIYSGLVVTSVLFENLLMEKIACLVVIY